MKNYICSSYLYICCFAWIRADKAMNLNSKGNWKVLLPT